MIDPVIIYRSEDGKLYTVDGVYRMQMHARDQTFTVQELSRGLGIFATYRGRWTGKTITLETNPPEEVQIVTFQASAFGENYPAPPEDVALIMWALMREGSSTAE